MTRSVPSDLLTALTQDVIEPFYAVEFLFDDEDGTSSTEAGYVGDRAIRLWTGYGDRTIGSDTYLGTAGLLNISGLEEVADLSAKGASVTLSGISSGIMSLALQEPYQGRQATIIFGERSVSSTITSFSGLIDEMPIRDGGESVTINLTIESKYITLQRSNVRRYTSANHKLRHPADTFFDWVTQLADAEIVWGRKIG